MKMLMTKIYSMDKSVEGDRGAGTRENRGGRWAGSGRRRSGMQESCEGGRRETIHKKAREATEEVREAGDVYPPVPPKS